VNNLLAWFKQPTTVAGFSTLVGTVMGVLTGSVNVPTAISLAVGSLVAMVIPDNTAAAQASKAAAGDLLNLGQALVTTPAAATTGSVPQGGTKTGS
jgi:hypothetical protein